jgi:hypothetical protein
MSNAELAGGEVLYSSGGGHGTLLGQLATAMEELLHANMAGITDGLPTIPGYDIVTADVLATMQGVSSAWRAFTGLRFPDKYPAAVDHARKLPMRPALGQFFKQVAAYLQMLRDAAEAEAATMEAALAHVFAGRAYVSGGCDVVALGLAGATGELKAPGRMVYAANERNGLPAWLEIVTIAGANVLADDTKRCSPEVAECLWQLQRTAESFAALGHDADAPTEPDTFLPALPIIERLAEAYQASGCTALPGADADMWQAARNSAACRDAAARLVMTGRAAITEDGDVVLA